MKEAHEQYLLLLTALLLLLASHHAATALLVSPVLLTKTTRIATRQRAGGCRPCHHLLVTKMAATDDYVVGDDDDAPFHFLEKEYELTEEKITQRGEIEERLMADSPTGPLLPNDPAAPVAAAVKPSRGFGGAGLAATKKQKRKKWSVDSQDNKINNNQSQDAKHHAQVLKTEGLVRMDGVLSEAVTDKLRDFVYDIRNAEVTKGQTATGGDTDTTTLQPKFPTIRRWDVSIPLFEYDNNNVATTTPTIAYQALQDILQSTAVGETMRGFLGTDQAPLYELSSYISDPGSSRQVMHADTPCFGPNDNQPILCTCFVALQEVRRDMGPTIWLPRTNTYRMHELFFGEEDDDDDETGGSTPRKDHLLQTQPSVLGLLPKGSCVLFDSRLLHCGTANQSVQDSRALFFFSFQHPNISLSNPGGDTASIRPDLKGRFLLADFI